MAPPSTANSSAGTAASLAHIPHIDSSAETVSQSNGSVGGRPGLPSSANTSNAGPADFYEDVDGPGVPTNACRAASSGPGGDALPVLGTCKALYGFEGASGDGTTISMQADDQLYLLEKDEGEGDGWTRVRHSRTGLEGFVPTAYLDMHWY